MAYGRSISMIIFMILSLFLVSLGLFMYIDCRYFPIKIPVKDNIKSNDQEVLTNDGKLNKLILEDKLTQEALRRGDFK